MGGSERADGRTDDAHAADPDAPWRPGYDGPPPEPRRCAPDERPVAPDTTRLPAPDPWSRRVAVAPPDDSATADGPTPLDDVAADEPDAPATAATGGTDRRRRRTAIAVAVLIAAAGAIGVSRTRTDPHVLPPARLPTAVAERWSVEVDGLAASDLAAGQFVTVADRTVVVRTGARVEGFDIDTGERAWTRPSRLPVDTFASSGLVARDTLVVVEAPSDDERRIVGIDAATGAERWTRDLDDGRDAVVYRGIVLDVPRADEDRPDGSDDGFDLYVLDASSGERSTPGLVAASFQSTWPYLPIDEPATDDDGGANGDRVVLYDLVARRTVGPRVEASGLEALAPLGSGAVGVREGGSLVLFDGGGDAIDEVDPELDAEIPVTWLSTSPDADLIVVSRPGAAAGFGATDRSLDELWRIDATIAEIRSVDGGGRRALTGSDDASPMLIDVATGRTLAALTSPPIGRFGGDDSSVTVVRNGLAHLADDGVRAIDPDGVELWRIRASIESVAVGDGLVVTVGDGRLTLYR